MPPDFPYRFGNLSHVFRWSEQDRMMQNQRLMMHLLRVEERSGSAIARRRATNVSRAKPFIKRYPLRTRRLDESGAIEAESFRIEQHSDLVKRGPILARSMVQAVQLRHIGESGAKAGYLFVS